jgi:hypothetical protein
VRGAKPYASTPLLRPARAGKTTQAAKPRPSNGDAISKQCCLTLGNWRFQEQQLLRAIAEISFEEDSSRFCLPGSGVAHPLPGMMSRQSDFCKPKNATFSQRLDHIAPALIVSAWRAPEPEADVQPQNPDRGPGISP